MTLTLRDSAVFMLDTVDRMDAFQYIFDRIVYGIFARFDGEALVPHILQRDHFFPDIFLGKLLSCDMLVFHMIRAVYTSVYAGNLTDRGGANITMRFP